MNLESISFITVTSGNVEEYGVFCAKNPKSEAYRVKVNWMKEKCNSGLRMIIAFDENKRQLGFIEYTDGENAWRPVNADGYLFIQCIAVMSKKDRNSGLASSLVGLVEEDARKSEKKGVCVITSKGSWLADSKLFIKNGFTLLEKKNRFDLLAKKLKDTSINPGFIDWEEYLTNKTGWNLYYSDQCPWHIKSVKDIQKVADEAGIALKVKKIDSPEVAKRCGSGFGTFSLIYNDRLLADHYISSTRFKNILSKELK